MSVDVYYIPGVKTEAYAKSAKAYDEVSKTPGLSDDLVRYMQETRDQFLELARDDVPPTNKE